MSKTISAVSMPADLKPIFERLKSDLANLWFKWICFKQLYGNTDQIDLLNDSAPAFFGMLQETLSRDLVLGIVRMTAEPRSCGEEQLVLKQLTERLPPEQAAIRQKFDDLLATMEVDFELFETIRHNLVAHRNLKWAIDSDCLLPRVSRVQLETALQKLAAFVNEFGDTFGETYCGFHETFGLGDGDTLVKCLRRVRQLRRTAE